MNHADGDIARTRKLHGLAFGLVGNLVGKYDHRIRIADFFNKITLIAADAFETVPALSGRRHVFGLQPVHTANQGNAHDFSPGCGFSADPMAEKPFPLTLFLDFY